MRVRSTVSIVLFTFASAVVSCGIASVGGVDPPDDGLPVRDASTDRRSTANDPGDPLPGTDPTSETPSDPPPSSGEDAGGSSSGSTPSPQDAGGTTPVSCPEAGSGGGVFQNHCYFAIKTSANQPTQLTACSVAGAHLVTITSTAERDFVNGIGTGDRWIGLTQPGTSKDKAAFSWITGETPVPDLWKAGQPDGTSCAVLDANGELEDRFCNGNNYAAICERE